MCLLGSMEQKGFSTAPSPTQAVINCRSSLKLGFVLV